MLKIDVYVSEDSNIELLGKKREGTKRMPGDSLLRAAKQS